MASSIATRPLTINDVPIEQRPRVATIRCLAVRWSINGHDGDLREAVAVRSSDGALLVVRVSRRGVTVRRRARLSDMDRVWSR